jgi:nitroimidazol reductase NimA-like FMN-containing flavoprotein (pyridoxamine 5'-phosphate oxidase superfamily)
LEQADALQLLEAGEYGVLSMASDGGAYGIPLNYVWDGQHSIYFHCANEGRKLECLKENNKVSFCVVGKTNVVSEKFSTAYESIVLNGTIWVNLSEEEKTVALKLLVKKYSPNHQPAGNKYIEQLFLKTEVMRLDVNEFSGKSKVIT